VFAPGFGQLVFVVDKVALEQIFFSSTSFSLANLYSVKFSILTITRSRYNRPEVVDVPSGPSMDSTPHYAN
jgi:hypothetical protein